MMTEKRIQLREEIKQLSLTIRSAKLADKQFQRKGIQARSMETYYLTHMPEKYTDDQKEAYKTIQLLYKASLEFYYKHIAASLMRGTPIAKIVKIDDYPEYALKSLCENLVRVIFEYGQGHKYYEHMMLMLTPQNVKSMTGKEVTA